MRYFETEMVGSQGATLSSFNSGIAEVNIAHPGGGTAIASAVSRKKFKGFRLEPNYVAAGRIDIQVVLNK